MIFYSIKKRKFNIFNTKCCQFVKTFDSIIKLKRKAETTGTSVFTHYPQRRNKCQVSCLFFPLFPPLACPGRPIRSRGQLNKGKYQILSNYSRLCMLNSITCGEKLCLCLHCFNTELIIYILCKYICLYVHLVSIHHLSIYISEDIRFSCIF